MVGRMSNPKVSIVIPVYNGSNYVKQAIDSSLSQTYKNIEVIVVNDGSNDDNATENIALSYGDKIRYFFKENGGVSTALNYGIKKMSGEYLSWLSHDDMYSPDKIERQIDYLRKFNLERTILYSDFKILEVATGKTCLNVTPAADSMCETLYLLFGGAIHGCTLLLPKSCFDEVGYFDDKLRTVQDYDIWFKLLKVGYEFKHIDGPLVISRHHEAQGTVAMADIHQQEVEQLYIRAYEEFYEQFSSFSSEQVASFVILLKNKMLSKAPTHITNRWQEDQEKRDRLLIHLNNRENYRKFFNIAEKLSLRKIRMKIYSSGQAAFSRLCHCLKK